jgi:hypothetical protein
MRFRCKVCGQDLVEQESLGSCSYCGCMESTDWSCPDGHYICESCRTARPEDLIQRTCAATNMVDPIALAGLLMKHPSFHAYGDEHHSLAAPVILAVLKNREVPGISGEQIRDAIERIKGIPVSVCGTRGDCGAAASAGAVLSILKKATPISNGERTEALRATAQTLMLIAEHGGPRCCKQAVFDTIRTTWDLLPIELHLEELPLHACDFAGKLKDCKTTRCPYFG